MAIKASGFRLSDITSRKAYTVLDGAALRSFYLTGEPQQFTDIEAAGSAKARECTLEINGLETWRPSVEAGFHSILRAYALHTHSVYANLAYCSQNGRSIAQAAFAGADYTWGMVPYVDPGAKLTFAIRDEIHRVEHETGKVPSVILMQNHGIIVHDDSAGQCLSIHADANVRLAKQFGITGDSFPDITIKALDEGLYEADVPYLKKALSGGGYTESFLLEQPLYPDQMVFLAGSFSMDRNQIEEGQCIAWTDSGRVQMRMDAKRAQVMTETLTAVVFLIEHIRAAGYPLSTMGKAAKHFIANWESEKYRRSLAGKE